MNVRDSEDPPREEPSYPREGAFDEQMSFPAPFIEAPELIESIVKRDGRKVPFERRKIAEAIYQAAQSGGGEDWDRAESLASGVAIYLAKELKGETPTAEQVQDAVERVLIHMDHVKTALAFARYRDKRARIRQLQRGDLRGLLTELAEARRTRGDEDAAGPESMFVRTSDERLMEWQRDRIVEALVRETGMERGPAEVVAIEVENQIRKANVTTLTVSLVRELVDAKLVEHGFEEHRRKHMRLGVPLYDAEQIICVPNRGETEGVHDPAATDLTLAERVKKEYALTQTFSQEVADAHLSGDVHLHDPGFIDRLHSCEMPAAYLAQFGAGFAVGGKGRGRLTRPPVRGEDLVAQLIQFTNAMERYVVDAVGWEALDVFMAPYVKEMDDSALGQLAHVLVFALSHGRSGIPARTGSCEFTLCWSVPPWLSKKTAIGPGSANTKYGYLAQAARRFSEAVLAAWGEQASTGMEESMTTPRVAISQGLFASQGHRDWLLRVSDHLVQGNLVEFVFERDGDRVLPEHIWEPLRVTPHVVTLNLPRAALCSNGDEKALSDELDRLVGLAARAHHEKSRFLERLLRFRDLGALSLLAREHQGVRLYDAARAEFRVGLTGLNECVQVMTGKQLHQSEAAQALAEKTAGHVAGLCRTHGERYGLHLVPSATQTPAVSRRFALRDLDAFGEAASAVLKADAITQDLCYSNGTAFAADAGLTPGESTRLTGELHAIVPAGSVVEVVLETCELSAEAVADFLQKVFYRSRVRRVRFV